MDYFLSQPLVKKEMRYGSSLSTLHSFSNRTGIQSLFPSIRSIFAKLIIRHQLLKVVPQLHKTSKLIIRSTVFFV